MINYYFYDGQLKSYLLQICNIFAGLKVQTGKGECAESEFLTVPITIGSRDRVVAAIQAGNTQNKPFFIPAMSLNMTGLTLSSVRKGVGTVDRKTILPTGGVFPDDLKVVTRVMPIPYIMTADLHIYASNTDQMFQIIEQLLVLFDPGLQIQTTDKPLDWTKLATIELVNISNEENFPIGADKRILMWTLSFQLPIYLSIPMDVKTNLINSISITLADAKSFIVNEFDENGNLVPFDPSKILTSFTVSG